jgi:hypothetical protein
MEGVVGLVLQAMHTHLREGKNHGLSAGRRKRVKTLVLKNVLTFIIAGTRVQPNLSSRVAGSRADAVNEATKQFISKASLWYTMMDEDN